MFPRTKLPSGMLDAAVKKRKRQDAEAERLRQATVRSERLIDSHFGRAVTSTSTQAQWLPLETVLVKVNKRLTAAELQETTATSLEEWVGRIAPKVLMNRAGIFKHSFGPKYQPLLLLNPGFARALSQWPKGSVGECMCGRHVGHSTGATKATRSSLARGTTDSEHKANCCLWTPPPTRHLAHMKKPRLT